MQSKLRYPFFRLIKQFEPCFWKKKMDIFLPAEVWAHILSFLSGADLRKVRLLNRQCWNLAEEYLRNLPVHTSNIAWAELLVERAYQYVELYYFSFRSQHLPAVHTLHCYGRDLPILDCQRLVFYRQKLSKPLKKVPPQLCLWKCTVEPEFMNFLQGCRELKIYKCYFPQYRYKLEQMDRVDIHMADDCSAFDLYLDKVREIHLAGENKGKNKNPCLEITSAQELFIYDVLVATEVKILPVTISNNWELHSCQAHFLNELEFEALEEIEAVHLFTNSYNCIGDSCRHLYLDCLPKSGGGIYPQIENVYLPSQCKDYQELQTHFPNAVFQTLPKKIPVPDDSHGVSIAERT